MQAGQTIKEKAISFLASRYFFVLVIILLTMVAFFLGRLSGLQDKRPPVRIISDITSQPPSYIKRGEEKSNNTPVSSDVLQNTAATSVSQSDSVVVASKNGTKYHYPWCAGAKQISAQNLVTFNSGAEARARGYSPATNCKGLK